MPARVVTLPIKCSTVKKVGEQLPKVVFIELLVWFPPSILYAMNDPLNVVTDPMVWIASCGIFLGIVAWGVLLFNTGFYVSEHLPRLECIRDEPEAP